MSKDTRPFDDIITTGTSDSVLASLYRSILHDLQIKLYRFDQLLVNYVAVMHRSATNIKDRTSVKSNLYKELLKSKITFKVFMKGLRVLNIKKFDLVVRLHHANGTITTHEKSVVLEEDDTEV